MKFTCHKNVILKEISIAQDIISSRNSLSILSNVLLETDNDKLIIKATDLKVSFISTIPVNVEISGSTTVFCDKFLGILRSLPDGEIEFSQIKDEPIVPEDITPTLSLGISMDHVMSITFAMLGGLIWYNYGPQYIFFLVAVLSFVNLYVAVKLKVE
jgi:hypothetical protein